MQFICLVKDSPKEKLKGVYNITSIGELYSILTEKEITSIEFTKEFIEKYFTKRGLSTFVQEASRIHPFCDFRYPEEFKFDSHMDILKLSNLKSARELSFHMLKDPENFYENFKELLGHYVNPSKEVMDANNKVATLQLETAHLNSKNKSLENLIEVNSKQMQTVLTRYNSLVSKIRDNNDRDFNANEFTGVDLEYSRYVRILYIKEITRVHFVDTLLDNLLEILRIIYGFPTRYIVIEPPYADSKIHLYNDLKDYRRLTYNDVLNSNIFMAGYQPKLMGDILNNPSNIDYLIVLDRSGVDYPLVRGSKVETIYTASSLDDVKVDVSLNRLISYDSNTLVIPNISEYDELTESDKIGRYSSMPITKELIKILEEG